MLAGEQSQIRDYWKLQGDKALAYGIKGVIIMVCSTKLNLSTDSFPMNDGLTPNFCRALTGMP